ncbi:osmoprotectant transport system substrate-binding protein [Haloactinopolyspora alba]|uniref:Osmoprotectant transport system substrate-binding protein n=1 Tax=Haloactinopolyspora alba TaxID=648780 RepID=A0A2P8DYW9_9ACTN|nr:ABC transporter substrate-binding protein [Haloactinopolyspora alba]PSL02428.1 osmoprotectant transport system substrate-binding protein [Haloactinopolyspora alba]
MTKRRRLAATTAGVGLILTLAACGDDEEVFQGDGGGDETAAGGSGELTVGGADFTEMVIMQEMYAALLEDAGYTVDIQSVGNREIYGPALESGEIDVVPEYAATFAQYLNTRANGPDAPTDAPIATNDAQETVEAARPLAEQYGLTILEPAQAADQNGFAVTQEFADQHGLTTISDLAEIGRPLTLAAVEECPDRPFCEPGLENVYGLEIVDPPLALGFSSTRTKQAVQRGDADLGLVATTDGTLGQFDLVLLEDDKNLQLADNIVPVVNTESAGDDAVAEALQPLSETLTTEHLTELNAQVDAERQQAEDVAAAYLEEQGLL